LRRALLACSALQSLDLSYCALDFYQAPPELPTSASSAASASAVGSSPFSSSFSSSASSSSSSSEPAAHDEGDDAASDENRATWLLDVCYLFLAIMTRFDPCVIILCNMQVGVL
jgi:hypothetical protein